MLYEGCSESNAYLIMLAHSDRGGSGGMAVEVEPFHQCAVTPCHCVTDGSRGTVRLNGICMGIADHDLNL